MMEALKFVGLGLLFPALFTGSLFAYIRYLRRIGPAHSAYGVDISSSDASLRFKKLEVRSQIVALGLTISFGVSTFFLLRVLTQIRLALLPPAQLTFQITDFFWAIISFFIGFGLALWTFGPLARSWWPEEMSWYAVCSSVRHGLDTDRLSRGLGIGMMLLALAAVPFGLNCYVQVRSDMLAVRPLLSLNEKAHYFRDLKSIETAPMFVAPSGRIRADPDFLVRFKDGDRWFLRDLPSGEYAERREVALLLSSKSGLPIKKVPIFQRSDLQN